MAKWPPSRLISWASSLGPSVGLLVEKVLSSVKHPEQRYNSALGIIRMGEKFGNARLEKASQRALDLGCHSYRFVNEMLKNNMDKLIVADDKNKQMSFSAVEEANTRGTGYYNKQTRH